MEETLKLSRIDYIGLLILTLVNLLLKIPITAQGFFAFTYDQGRDLLKVAQIVFEHQPTLIGPTSGLQGIFYGPWWYYFLSPILFFSKGNPQGVANFFGLLAVLTVFLYGHYCICDYGFRTPFWVDVVSECTNIAITF